MDARRVLLLVICIINGTFANQNDWGGPNNIRRIRRINEYLVPPPPPRFHPPGRIPRLANFQSTPPPGYFTVLMEWLNPFSSESSLQPPPPPPLSPQPKAPYPPKFIQPAPLPPATTYNGPPPVVYEKPPLPSFSINDHSGYPVPIKTKSCNPCNKVPWMPIQHGAHSGDASYAPPPFESPDGEYLSKNHEIPHDTYHAASQEVRAPDFPFAPPLPNGQDGSFTAPLHPHLFPGAMPPLFKAEDFNYPVQVTPDENSGYLGSPPSSVSSASIGNGSFLNVAGLTFNGGHNGQSVYPDSSVHSGLGIPQEVGYINLGASNGEFENFHQDHATHGDLSSSGTQVSQGHANSIPDKQGLESTNTDLFDSININHQTSLSDSVLNHQPLEMSDNGEFYDVTKSSGLLGGFLDNASQTDQNLPSSYGISGLDRTPDNYEHQHNDLSFSASVAEDNSRALLHTSDESSRKIADSINFEESPLLDFTHKDESRTQSSSIPSTSNAFASFESAEIAGTTVAPGDEIFGTRQGIVSTESYLPTDYLETIDTVTKESKINNNTTQDMKNIREQDVSPSDKAKDLWSSVLSISISTDRESSGNVMPKPYDNVTKEKLSDNINLDEISRQQGAKKNKQVQVIIPYTSQYTPHPFYPSHERNIDESNHDNYIGEESRNRIKVVSPPNSSHIFQSWSTTLAIFEDTTKKPIVVKANNSIDVHNLQKNIDDWTIEEYSKNISTASTASPSSGNPYLFPSKKIPNEYFMTTESIDHVADSHNDNIKTITLSGFSFNDQEYKESVNHRMEGSREQVIKIEKSTESPTNTPTASKNMWRDFPVGISSDKERVYIVTPQPTVTTSSLNSEYRQEKALKEAERKKQESKKTSQIDTKKTKKSDTFESIEKAYQVLPQAVNNLAVASTGPESVPLWSIMEHEEFASPVDNDYDDNDTESPMLYSKLSKESRARR